MKFSTRTLFATITALAAVFGFYRYYVTDQISVSAPTGNRSAADNATKWSIWDNVYAGFSFEPDRIENVVRVTGDLKETTRVLCKLIHVVDGEVGEMLEFRSHRQKGFTAEWRDQVEMTIAISYKKESIGWKTQVGRMGSFGMSSNRDRSIDHDVSGNVSKVYEQQMSAGSAALVYIVGNSKFMSRNYSSAKEFAALNDTGEYLVVELSSDEYHQP